jgi:hypothetical protein
MTFFLFLSLICLGASFKEEALDLERPSDAGDHHRWLERRTGLFFICSFGCVISVRTLENEF